MIDGLFFKFIIFFAIDFDTDFILLRSIFPFLPIGVPTVINTKSLEAISFVILSVNVVPFFMAFFK